MKTVITMLVVFGAIMTIVLLVGSDRPQDGSAPEERSQVENIELGSLVQEFPEQGFMHVAPGEEHPDYNSNPPTSGWHYAIAPEWGIYENELEDESALHAVEHGGIWVSYTGVLTEEEQSELDGLFADNDKALVISPRPANNTRFAVVSWGRLMELETLDAGLIQDFINTYKNQTHEPFAG